MPDSLPEPTPDLIRQLDWKAIAAMSANRAIGNNSQIPWNIPEDFKWVKQCTSGQAIAMGRKTYESIGRPLPGRTNIVLSRNPSPIDGCILLPGLQELFDYKTDRQIWIFGGAEIYRQTLPYISDLYLTVIHQEYPGDAFFPPFEQNFLLHAVVRETPQFTIRHYRNIALPQRTAGL